MYMQSRAQKCACFVVHLLESHPPKVEEEVSNKTRENANRSLRQRFSKYPQMSFLLRTYKINALLSDKCTLKQHTGNSSIMIKNHSLEARPKVNYMLGSFSLIEY